MAKFKHGDQVKLREDIVEFANYSGLFFFDYMAFTGGKKVIFVSPENAYMLKDADFYYSEEMLEEAK